MTELQRAKADRDTALQGLREAMILVDKLKLALDRSEHQTQEALDLARAYREMVEGQFLRQGIRI